MVGDVEVCCAGCERVYVVDQLGLVDGDELGPCGDCGCPLYVVDVEDEVGGAVAV